jgi:putative hydrolase of the HAD superfamily
LKFPRAVFFDLDDTLITHKEALERALASVYPNYPELGAAYDLQGLIGAWKESLRWDYKNLPGDKLTEHQRRLGRIRKIWGPVKSNLSDAFCLRVAAEYLQVYQENWNLHEDVPAMLDDFAGVRMGVVTNGYVTQQNQKLCQLRVDGHFRTVVTSEEAGVGKPAPAIFQLACQRLEVQTSDAAYVGDLLETDALGAQNAGLTGIWLNRTDEHDERSSQVPTIRSLAALKTLFA